MKAALLLALALPLAAAGQSVTLQGMLGGRALLIVDGAAPRSVAPGDSLKGVKVISTQGDEAVLEVGGKRLTMRVGDAPANVGTASSTGRKGNRIVLSASSGGHFHITGTINGGVAQFLVDTGATSVSLGAPDATRLGVKYKAGEPVQMNTANGVTQAWRVRLDSLRIGDVEVYGVEAIVSPQAMPFVLLGNSFLTRFQMKRENDQMVLERRY